VKSATALWSGFLRGSAFCFLVAGCSPPTIWTSSDVKSPDGQWIAFARTVENSGFGGGAVITNVYLRRATLAASPQPVLSLTHDYRLTSQSGATIHLAMTWLASDQFQVTYDDGLADVGFQVSKMSNMTISVRRVSPERSGK
jgi:hypothetical protein